jgi:PTS system nitrogen regulatory IIA component
MILSLMQVAESFGVSAKIVEGWARDEGLPHALDRGRLLFDRAQVARWAASRGLATRVGFLAAEPTVLSTGFRLEDLLRAGGIWRDVAPADLPSVLAQVVSRLPGLTDQVQQLLELRLRAPGGVTVAPVGDGFALPHPSARVALGRDCGLVALVMLKDALAHAERAPDDVPVRWLFFFIAPSPRAHLDLLARLSRALRHPPWRDLVKRGASDAELLAGCAVADAAQAAR